MNVLFIISDQHRYDATGLHGTRPVRTPNLDALAAEGARFSHAYCPHPICGPSRGCALTGTYSHRCDMFSHGKESVLPEMPTMGSAFRAGGYRTAAIGKLHVRGEERLGRDLGFDQRALRYYTYEYEDYIAAVGLEAVDRHAPHRPGSPYNKAGYAGRYNPCNRPTLLDADEDLMFDNLVAGQTMAFLREPRSKPFLLWCGLEKPHPEWTAPKRFHDLYDPEEMEVPETFWEERTDLPEIMQRRFRPTSEGFGAFRALAESGRASKEEVEKLVRGSIAAYYASVSFLDWNVGRILNTLEEEGLRDDTLVIYTSDHGDNLFEHGLVQKHCFFEGSVRVPLIFSHPSLPKGREVHRLANLIDVFSTMLEMAQLPVPDTVQGQPLAEIMRREENPREGRALSDYYSFGTPERMLRAPDWKYIYSHGSGEQLYDMEKDPGETRNLAGDSEYKEKLQELKAEALADWEEIERKWRAAFP